jgi:vitamin B12 transporter
VLSGEVGWHDGGRSASLLIRRVGAQYEDDLNTQRMRPATTIDAFVAWPLAGRLQLVARGENLLDETVIAGLGSDGTVERATPRTLWIGLRLTGL